MLPSQPYNTNFHGNFKEMDAFFYATFDERFKNASTFTEQVGIMCSYLRNQNVMVSFKRIGEIFNKKKQCVQYHFECYKKMKNNNGRPPILTKEEIEKVREELNRYFYSKIGPFYPSYEDISDFIYFNFGKSIIPDILRHIIRLSFKDEVKSSPE